MNLVKYIIALKIHPQLQGILEDKKQYCIKYFLFINWSSLIMLIVLSD